TYNNVKDYPNALKYYTDALNVYRQIQSKSKIADNIYNIATVYYSDKQYEQSERSLDTSIALQIEIKDQAGLLNSYIYKGLIQQYFYGNYTKALGFMKQALQLAEATTSESNVAYTQSSIAGLYQNMGQYDSAALYFDLAIARYKKLDDKKNIASAYMSKGFFYSDLADYIQARKLFDQSLEIAEQSSNKNTKANALSGIAQIELFGGNFSKAFQLNSEVMQLWKEENNPWGIADAYISLGNVRNRQSGFDDAIKYYQKADSMYKNLRMEKARATSINNIGDIYFNQNDFVRSLPNFFEALKILQKANDDKRFISLVKANIGEVYIYQKKYSEAEKWLSESLEIAKSIKNKSQVLSIDIILGRLKTITKEYAVAKTYFEDANKLVQETNEKLTAVLLEAEWGKWFYLNNDFINAEKHLQNCINLSQAMGFRTYIWKAYAGLAEIKAQQNNTTLAIAQLEKAIKVVEELKSSLTGGEEAKKIFASDESIVELYQRMAKYLKAVGRNDEALAFIEKSNIENINLRLKNDDAIGNATVKEKKTEINQYVKQTSEELAKPSEQQNKEKIARLEKMTTVAEADYQQFIIDLAKKYPGRTDLQQIDARQFKQERKYIPQDVALLSYLLTDHELSVFVVMKDTLLIKDIPIERKLLEEKINRFYKLSAYPPTKDGRRGAVESEETGEKNILSLDQLSEELYDLLINPAKDAIANKKRIAIVPSGLLCFVPFQSLGTKSATGMNYFGDEKQVFYVNKITTVTNGRNESLKDLKIVAVGNADNSLANAEVEVKTLKQNFPTAMVYVGNEATKQKVLNTQGEYNILHLATHGILDYANAENSYLVFAPDKITGDDGKLKINDIYRIKNFDRFRMVTLSACETSVVQNITDGWPISTASAFIEAGVPTVIATLWKVDDKATSILVEKFYANMKTMDKVAALQNAQQFLRSQKGYDDPNYWAPFQLVGLWQ
ncbi:MAG TPA: CHAT domain-containing tetratricopeptide repeat protein, partial [Chitinophagaceae bacterium]